MAIKGKAIIKKIEIRKFVFEFMFESALFNI